MMTPGVRMTMVKRDSWRLCFSFHFSSSIPFSQTFTKYYTSIGMGNWAGGTRDWTNQAFFASAGIIRNIFIGLIIFLSFYYCYYKVLLQTFCYLLLASQFPSHLPRSPTQPLLPFFSSPNPPIILFFCFFLLSSIVNKGVGQNWGVK